MTIAVFHNLQSGGAKRAVSEWVKGLASRHAVDVYTLTTANHDFCDLRPHVRQHREYAFGASTMFQSPFGRINQLQRWRDLRRLDALSADIAADIDGGGYDVAFVHPCMFTAIPGILRHLSTPSVYYLHEPIGQAQQAHAVVPASGWRETANRLDPSIQLYRRRLAREQAAGVRAVSVLLANSAFTRHCMSKAYGRSSTVSPCGVDTEMFRPIPHAHQGRHVLSVGELTPRKGFPFLVEAIGTIPRAARPALRLACNAALESERSVVERLASTLGVDLDVRMHLDTQALVREYNEAALFVYAPHSEPLGLAALEAMACGRAVIGVREGGVMETVLDSVTGRLVPRHAPVFGAAIADALASPDACARWGTQARDHVHTHWSWTRSTELITHSLAGAARAGISTTTDSPDGATSEPATRVPDRP